MPAGLVRPSSEIEPIVGIQFGIFSPDEIERRSVVEITTHTTYEGNEPKVGGLFDPRMGVLENGKTCRSCGQTNHNCPGHFGHYRLARPVYFFQFMDTITSVLKCVCIRCSKLLVDKELRKGILRRRGEARWREILNASSNISRCGQETEDGCGARQPDRYEREGIARIVAEWDSMEGGGATADQATKQRQPLEVEYVLRLFRRITDEDVDFMGLNRYWCRPDWMICTVLPVAPPQVRPSVVQDNNQRSEDDLTHKYFDIIKADNVLKMKIDANASKNVIDEYTNVVQYHIATLVDNQIPGVAPSAQRSGRPLKSIQQRLGSKEGRIRYNIQGKRVEFSARSVITPDPNLSIGELGVPIKIAMNLTVPERVTQYNKEQLYRLVQNGADTYPGAKSIVKPDGRMISLKHLNRKEIVLHLGDVVNRHLADGDIVLFNRQPTLHRMSMMGHRAKVLPFNTFRLNVMVTAPYNADFDGDEMNAHLPQSYEGSTELMEIAAVPQQIISPRNGKPVIGVVQDTLVGSYRITRPIVDFNRREFMNLMMWNKRFEGVVPTPRKQSEGQGRWTGQQVMSQLMPPINLKMKNDSWNQDKVPENEVEIVEGSITQGIFDKSIFAKPSKGIVHVTYNDYGPKDTVNLLDSLQNTIEQFLVYNGFSVGISDLVADSKTNADIQAAIEKKKKEIEDIILQVHLDLFDNNTGKSNQEEFESRVIGSLNKATEEAGKMGLGSLSKENRLTAMVKAGSKGSTINIAQMMACVGQQAPEGRRIPYGFSDRTLPHYKKYDDGAEARGFVESSFIRGLTPQEFFFHAMSGREGLIDTAVKSVTGDTPILVLEDGVAKRVEIGEWINNQMDANQVKVEHHDERDLELLNLEKTTYIPTVNEDGEVSWGLITAITRHDPGDRLYKIQTLGGRSVTVSESKSLLIWNQETAKFEHTSSPNVRAGHFVPVSMNVPKPPTEVKNVQLQKYLPKTTYLYGTDFKVAQQLIAKAMEGREKIPAGWWQEHNGKEFTLPYETKARFTRTTVRSNLNNLDAGFIYPFTTNREHARIPDQLELNKENGIFLGLFLAEGNVDVKSGYVQITNNNTSILQFVKDWFENLRLTYTESTKLNAIGGVTTSIRGYSTILAQFLDKWVGHGAQHKHIPTEAYLAPEEFIVGVLNGYFSGDGTVGKNCIEVGSASSELIEGINYLCNRLGIFGKMFQTHLAENNLGTENILPTMRLSIRAQWASRFASKVEFLDDAKEAKRNVLKCSEEHRNFQSQNDVVLDEIIEIKIVGTEEYPKLYDLTVPSTLNFGLANGLHVVDTADTGYIQRQLIKAMEDLVVQYDGTVRDARGNIVQFHYGEDGVNSTKIESASLGLAKQTEAEIRREYGLEGADLSEVLADGIVRPEDTELLNTFVEDVLADRKMLVEGVYRWKLDGSLFAPVNLERVLLNLKVRFKIDGAAKTDLTPAYVLEALNRVISKTQPYHKLWKALLRFYCAPHKLIVKERFSRMAFDTLCELLVTKNWQAWAQPGEQVGIIAAQSIGEPSTQMTLNSVDWDTDILIAKNGKILSTPIGEFIDEYYNACEDNNRIKHLPNNQIYIDLKDGNDWKAISCDESGKMMWTTLEAITRHPVINADGTDTILEVTLQSGRKVKATKAKSFLTRQGETVVDINGSDLKVGDVLPIGRALDVQSVGCIKEISLRSLLPPTEWMYGSEVQKALAVMNKADETGERHWYQNGTAFTVPYHRSDTFREAFQSHRNSNAAEIRPGFVYPKRTRPDQSQIPENLPLDKEFGFFVGAYLAEGSSNATQINITNNDEGYLNRVADVLKGWNVGYHIVSEKREAKRTGIAGTTTSLIIHSTLLAKVFAAFFGRTSQAKTMPDWVFQSPDAFVAGLLDGYISGDGTVAKKSGCITVTSVSEALVTRMSTLLARFGIFTTKRSRMPEQGSFEAVQRYYTLYVPVESSQRFAKQFSLTIAEKQAVLDQHFKAKVGPRSSRRDMCNDVVWDPITEIREVKPITGFVYDLTVEKTRNFTTLDMICMKDTFHLAGVAAKSNMTRGVPRLKELLKVTQNPKATSLTVFLKPEFREKKEKAREVAQDLELTLLRDICIKTAVYFDPKDDETILAEDRDMIKFFNVFADATERAALGIEPGAGAAAGAAGEEAAAPEKWSKWVLRLELDRERMFNKNITMDDIAGVLDTRFGSEIRTVYSDFNSQKMVMRLRVLIMEDPMDDLGNLKKFQNKLLNSVVIRGVPGIKAVTFRKEEEYVELVDGEYKPIKQYVLDTDGSNFLEVMNHPAVDGTHLMSTHVHDIYENLGIEATRQVLLNEISELFEEAGVNFRHLGLLCDVMTRAGRLMSVDRYGINKNDIGPLAKSSFEETASILLKAAQFGEMDPVTGVSANIMMGQPIRGGTSFSQILLDESALARLMEGLPPLPEGEDEEEDDAPTQDEVDKELYSDPADLCSATQLRMNVMMPPAGAVLEEPDMVLQEIQPEE